MSRMTLRIALLICFVFSVCLVGVHAEAAAEQAECRCPCPCPEKSVTEPSPDSAKCPETVVLDHLTEVYDGVTFSHAEHAEMAEEGCATCHHHTPVGVYKKCGSCHEKRLFESDVDKLNILNLKAAYHRQCIECHVEWESGPTGCTECHAIRE